MSRPQTRTDLHRAQSQREISTATPALDVRGISADRKRLQGRFPSPYKFRLVPKNAIGGSPIDDGD